jgi:hypothetical protein
MLVACEVDLSGLNQLLDPEPTYLNLPGRRVVAGKFSQISVGGTDRDGAYVLAFDNGKKERTLSITPFEGGATCNAGTTDGYRSFQFGVRNTLPLTFPFTETTDSVRSLHFINPRCEEVMDAIPNSPLPFWPVQALESPPGYLTLTRGGDFLVAQPWNSKVDALAKGVRLIRTTQDKFWSLEKHVDDLAGDRFQLVVRDTDLKELARVGDDVTEFDVTDAADERAAYVENGDLHTVATDDDFEPSSAIDHDVCNVAFPGGFRGRGLSYFSPCDDKRLVLYGSARQSDPGPGKSDAQHILRPDAIGDPAVIYQGDRGYVFFVTTDNADPETQTLYGGAIGSGTEAVGVAPSLGSGGAPRVTSVGSSFQFIVDLADGVGTMIRWKPGSTVKEVATRVEECAGTLCIVDFEGETGNAVIVQQDGTLLSVGKGVPSEGVTAGPDGMAIVTDFDGHLGTLTAAQSKSTSFEKIAEKVLPGRYDFLQNLTALAYLHDFDTEAGDGVLGVRVLETGDTFDTGIRASEWQEVGWPQPGLLYSVVSGDDAGIWFAGLR